MGSIITLAVCLIWDQEHIWKDVIILKVVLITKFLWTRESSSISSILSMDCDTWEDTFTSPQSLIKLLAETDKQHGSLKMPILRKVQDSNQSRFSFARQDDFFNQDSNLGHSFANSINNSSASHHCMEKKDSSVNYLDISSYHSSVESSGSFSSHPFSTSKFAAPKPSISPPGFSLPSRVAPPGFPTHGTINYDENQSMQNSLMSFRNAGSSVNVEFIDPAIVKVGNGMVAARSKNPGFDTWPALSPHFGPYDQESQFQMLMQQPMFVKHNHRFPDHFRNRFSPPNDAYGISSMLMGESPPSNPSPFAQVVAQQVRNLHMSNGYWGGWEEMKHVNNLGVSELLMNGRLGLNKVIPSHEDLKYQSSSNLYNRGFAL